jgi:1,4-alpha-glucan branching enzyme
VEKPIEFRLSQRQARQAAVVGSFNNWDVNRTPMSPEAEGDWKATVWLPTGRYEYRFVVDGQWISDPSAKESVQNTFGSTNSVLVV